MTAIDKSCAACRHLHKKLWPDGTVDPECRAPQNIDRRVYISDVVSGQQPMRHRKSNCFANRIDGWLSARIHNTCGREGRWFGVKQ
jgi:hypothetical protein